jgi:hypothetical protein
MAIKRKKRAVKKAAPIAKKRVAKKTAPIAKKRAPARKAPAPIAKKRVAKKRAPARKAPAPIAKKRVAKKTAPIAKKHVAKKIAPLTLRTLNAELPIGRAFLDMIGNALREPSRVRVRLNPNRTIDGELKVRAPEKWSKWREWLLGQVEPIYWMAVQSFTSIAGTWWLRLGARFKRTEHQWRTYKLSVFKSGLEQAMVHVLRHLGDAAETWATLRILIANVFNAHLAPNPRSGRLRPEYKLVEVLIRIHRGARAPVY